MQPGGTSPRRRRDESEESRTMALKRCDNGHYYDPVRHTTCPSCGAHNIEFGATRARPAEAPAPSPPDPRARRPAAADTGKTVSLVQKQSGIDPVVGWLVCVQGPDRGRDFRLRPERNFLGRSDRMDVCIPGDATISRENHAIVSFNPKNA